jgi:glutamate formiminotransferase/formiminotetrahydrofolate cyclodeaminase
MVANLTVGRKRSEVNWAPCDETAVRAQNLKDALLRAIDEDTEAFNALMAANRLPRNTPELAAARDLAVREATRRAVLVPLAVIERAAEIVDIAARLLEIGNPSAASDAASAASCALAAGEAAFFNVATNLKDLARDEWVFGILDRADRALARLRELAPKVRARFLGESAER